MKRIIYGLMALLILMTSFTVLASASAPDNCNAEVNEADSPTPRVPWCELVGHTLVTTLTLKTEHKVRATAPRCKQSVCEVTTCEQCLEYREETILNYSYIDCCS